jgi:Mn-dependent transcriptional regulator
MSLDPAITDQISHAIQTVQEREDIEGEIHVHVSKKRIKIDPINAFALCFTGSLSVIIRTKKLSPTAIALLLTLLDLAKHGNLVSVNQKGLAGLLGVKQPAISKALAKLVAAGIIIELPEGQYFNPQLITRQGLDTVARKHPAAVVAGIAALAKEGMEPNWKPPFR